MSKVSVIIPTYNCAKYVSEAIESVLAQTYKDYEIIVIDDGSTDNTREVLAPYIEKGLIRYVWQENKGVSAARNKGIELAKGEYIAFLDADDLFLPRSLEMRIEAMNKSQSQIVFSFYILIKKDGEEIIAPKDWRSIVGNERFVDMDCLSFVKEALEKGMPICTITVLLSRELILKRGIKFDESLVVGEDVDFWWRAVLDMGVQRIGIVNEPLSVYRFFYNSWQNNPRREVDSFSLNKKLYFHLLKAKHISSKKIGRFCWQKYWEFSRRDYQAFFILKALKHNPTNVGYWKNFIGFLLGRNKGIYGIQK